MARTRPDAKRNLDKRQGESLRVLAAANSCRGDLAGRRNH